MKPSMREQTIELFGNRRYVIAMMLTGGIATALQSLHLSIDQWLSFAGHAALYALIQFIIIKLTRMWLINKRF